MCQCLTLTTTMGQWLTCTLAKTWCSVILSPPARIPQIGICSIPGCSKLKTKDDRCVVFGGDAGDDPVKLGDWRAWIADVRRLESRRLKLKRCGDSFFTGGVVSGNSLGISRAMGFCTLADAVGWVLFVELLVGDGGWMEALNFGRGLVIPDEVGS